MYEDLIGKPWALPCKPPESYDCWALAVEVRSRLGLKTHSYDVDPEKRTHAHRRDFATPDPNKWVRLPEPRQGCLVGFGSRYVVHCGVYLNGSVIHANQTEPNWGAVMAHSLKAAQLLLGPHSFWEMRIG